MGPRAHRLHELVSFLPSEEASPERVIEWGLPRVAGRLVEISASGSSASLTAVFGLVIDAQQRGEPTAWITLLESTFFPPDVVAGSVDLDRLPVVRTKDPLTAGRAALHLLRSGGFGLVVIDFGIRPRESRIHRIPTPLQTKLVGLAQKHDTAVVVLTEKTRETPSLGSLISLRAEARRVDARHQTMSYEVQLHILKDKRLGPGNIFREVCYGPDGLC